MAIVPELGSRGQRFQQIFSKGPLLLEGSSDSEAIVILPSNDVTVRALKVPGDASLGDTVPSERDDVIDVVTQQC